MTCGCGRSPDSCRGWHDLTEEEWRAELAKFKQEQNGSFTVTEIEHYTDSLFRFRLNKPADFTFKAGEFTMIGMCDNDTKRAYSIASAPEDEFLEFYSIKVPCGPLTSRLKDIKIGDSIEVGSKTTGTLILDNLYPGGTLWLLATGTGVAPFISLARHNQTYKLFDKIHVVWSVRESAELNAYHNFLQGLDIDYTPIVTRDSNWAGEQQRITTLIEQGKILKNALPQSDKVMLCGNMDFNIEIRDLLINRGWLEGNKKSQGSFVLEKAFVS